MVTEVATASEVPDPSDPSDASDAPDAPGSQACVSLDCIGISHRTAAAALRERASFSPSRLREALAAARRDSRIERLAIISTCLRTELYAELPRRPDYAPELLIQWWASMCGIPSADITPHAYALTGPDAARHLYRVTAGLDSVVLGEAQIVSQVAVSLRHSVAMHAASPLLKCAFKGAVHAGERARGAVWGRLQAASLGSAAVDAAAAAANGIRGRTVVILGAGEIAELALRALGAHAPARVTVANRSLESATELGGRHGADACGLDALEPTLCAADIVIAATRATVPFIHHDMVASAMSHRAARPLTIVDVSLPRNVDVNVRRVAGAKLIGIDDLAPYIATAHSERRAVMPRVERLVEEELGALTDRLRRRVTTGARRSAAVA